MRLLNFPHLRTLHKVAFFSLCGVAVSAAFVFAEGSSAASPADLNGSVSVFYYADWRNYHGFP
jgi:hypothetical protein